MAKKKKLTPNEIKERRKLRERERRERIRNDSQKYQDHLIKEKLRYIKNKEKGVIKLAQDMTPRDLRQKRKKWKDNTSRYREKKKVLQKALNNTPPESELDESLESEGRIHFNSTPNNSKIQLSLPTCDILPIVKEFEASSSQTSSNSSLLNIALPSRQKNQGRKIMRRDRSKIYRENMKLREENARLKKKIEATRKKEYRKNKKLWKPSESNKIQFS